MSDLIISSDQTLSGIFNCDTFKVLNGITLTIGAYDGSTGGKLIINCKQAIIDGIIDGSGKGYGGGGGGGGSCGWKSEDHGGGCQYSGGSGGSGTSGGSNGESIAGDDKGGYGGNGGGPYYGNGGSESGPSYDPGNDGSSASKNPMIHDLSINIGSGGGGGSGGCTQHTGPAASSWGAPGSGGGGAGAKGGGALKIISEYKIIVNGNIYTTSKLRGNGSDGGEQTDYGNYGGAGANASSSGSSNGGLAGTTYGKYSATNGGRGGGGAGGDIVLYCNGIYGVYLNGIIDLRGYNSSGDLIMSNGGNLKIFSTHKTINGTLYYGDIFNKKLIKGIAII